MFQLVILLLSFLLFLLTVFNTYPVQSGHFKKMTSKFRSYYGMFGVYLGFTILLNALKLSYRRDNPDNWAAIYTEDTFFDFVYCVQRTLTPIYYYSFIRLDRPSSADPWRTISRSCLRIGDLRFYDAELWRDYNNKKPNHWWSDRIFKIKIVNFIHENFPRLFLPYFFTSKSFIF